MKKYDIYDHDIYDIYDITRHYDFIRHYNIYFMNLINNKEVTRYHFKANQAIFSGSRETAST
jgi:hypothetical protein